MATTFSWPMCYREGIAAESEPPWGRVAALAGAWMVALAVPAWAIGPAGPSWEPRELVSDSVDFRDQDGADRMLAFDHHGAPAIAFKDADLFGDVRYGRKLPGIGWTAQDLFPNTGLRGRGSFASLAFDRHERPAISYRSADGIVLDAAMQFSHFDGQAWQHQAAEGSPNQNYGAWSSLAFDRLGRAAIAYMNETFSIVRFAHDVDGDFDFSDEFRETVETLDVGDGASYLSLAFDPLNRPMVSYVTDRGELKFSMKETLGWLTTTVDDRTAGGEIASSLAIDPDTGYPAIAYTSLFLNASLKYAQWDGSEWVIEEVDANGSTGAHPSLAFDPTDGNPAIAYHRLDRNDLRIAWHDGMEWQTDIVDADGGAGAVGLNPSIAFREFGVGDRVAAIAYHDDSGNLYYIEDPPVASVAEPSALALCCAGFAAAAVVGWRRRAPRRGGENR